MKRALPAVLIFLSGCIVQSFYPFYTDKSKVALPSLDGEWDVVIAFGDKPDESNTPPWQISYDEVVAYDPVPLPHPCHIHVTFFKAGEQLFCDSIAGPFLDGKVEVPWYWAWNARPVHTVTKVETNGDALMFKPLDLDWLTNRIAKGKVSLPRLSRREDDTWPLFTAMSLEWEKFLTKYANNADAFPTNHIYVLKRHVTTPAK